MADFDDIMGAPSTATIKRRVLKHGAFDDVMGVSAADRIEDTPSGPQPLTVGSPSLLPPRGGGRFDDIMGDTRAADRSESVRRGLMRTTPEMAGSTAPETEPPSRRLGIDPRGAGSRGSATGSWDAPPTTTLGALKTTIPETLGSMDKQIQGVLAAPAIGLVDVAGNIRRAALGTATRLGDKFAPEYMERKQEERERTRAEITPVGSVPYQRLSQVEAEGEDAFQDDMATVMEQGGMPATVAYGLASGGWRTATQLLIAKGVTGAFPGGATRGANYVRNTLTHAAKFAAWRYAATPGDNDAKLKSSALAMAYVSTPAISSGASTKALAVLFDMALNSGISVASGGYDGAGEFAAGLIDGVRRGEYDATEARQEFIQRATTQFVTDLMFSLGTPSRGGRAVETPRLQKARRQREVGEMREIYGEKAEEVWEQRERANEWHRQLKTDIQQREAQADVERAELVRRARAGDTAAKDALIEISRAGVEVDESPEAIQTRRGIGLVPVIPGQEGRDPTIGQPFARPDGSQGVRLQATGAPSARDLNLQESRGTLVGTLAGRLQDRVAAREEGTRSGLLRPTPERLSEQIDEAAILGDVDRLANLERDFRLSRLPVVGPSARRRVRKGLISPRELANLAEQGAEREAERAVSGVGATIPPKQAPAAVETGDRGVQAPSVPVKASEKELKRRADARRKQALRAGFSPEAAEQAAQGARLGAEMPAKTEVPEQTPDAAQFGPLQNSLASVPPKADGSVDMEARQRVLDEWKAAPENAEAVREVDGKFPPTRRIQTKSNGYQVPILVSDETSGQFVPTVEIRDGVITLHPERPSVGGSLRNRYFRYVDEAIQPLGENVFVRMTDNPEDYKHVTEGTHRGSLARNQKFDFESPEEEGGLSVSYTEEFPADYGYLLTGTVIGQDTDGAPLLDTATAKPLTKLLTLTRVRNVRDKRTEKRLSQLGLPLDFYKGNRTYLTEGEYRKVLQQAPSPLSLTPEGRLAGADTPLPAPQRKAEEPSKERAPARSPRGQAGVLPLSDQTVSQLRQTAREQGVSLKGVLKKRDILAKLEETRPRLQPAFHGTPHVWPPETGFPHGRPKLDKIGTGEGAATFGWGWYGAENREVADTYRRKLSAINDTSAAYDFSKLPPSLTPTEIDEKGILGQKMMRKGNLPPPEMRRWQELQSKDRAYKDAVEDQRPKGASYTLDIPDNVMPKLLDWDNPLSTQPAVRERVKAAMKERGFSDEQIASMFERDITGEQAYTFMASIVGKQAASEFLSRAGIPGNKYLDQGSRGVTQWTVTRVGDWLDKNYAIRKAGKTTDDAAIEEMPSREAALAEAEKRNAASTTSNYVIWDQPTLDRIALLERNGEKLDAIRAQQPQAALDTTTPTDVEGGRNADDNQAKDLPDSQAGSPEWNSRLPEIQRDLTWSLGHAARGLGKEVAGVDDPNPQGMLQLDRELLGSAGFERNSKRHAVVGATAVPVRNLDYNGIQIGDVSLLNDAPVLTPEKPLTQTEAQDSTADHELTHHAQKREDTLPAGTPLPFTTIANDINILSEAARRYRRAYNASVTKPLSDADLRKELTADLFSRNYTPWGIDIRKAWGKRIDRAQKIVDIAHRVFDDAVRQGLGEGTEQTRGAARFQPRQAAVTPEQDKAYLAAVEAKDVEAQQRMVDEAAKNAGYTVGPVFHGTWTPTEFSIFDANEGVYLTSSKELAKTYQDARSSQVGRLLKTKATTSQGIKRAYDAVAKPRTISLYAKFSNPLDWTSYGDFLPLRSHMRQPIGTDNPSDPERLARIFGVDIAHLGRAIKTVFPNHPLISNADSLLRSIGLYDDPSSASPTIFLAMGTDKENLNGRMKRLIEALGYDGVIFRDFGVGDTYGERVKAKTYVAFNSSQIKSADPVTYKDGKPIPLSQRFNQESPDIRMQPKQDPTPDFAELLQRISDVAKSQDKAIEITQAVERGAVEGKAARAVAKAGRKLAALGGKEERKTPAGQVSQAFKLGKQQARNELHATYKDKKIAIGERLHTARQYIDEHLKGFRGEKAKLLANLEQLVKASENKPRTGRHATIAARKLSEIVRRVDQLEAQATHRQAVTDLTKVVKQINTRGVSKFAPERKTAVEGLLGEFTLKKLKDNEAVRDAIDEIRATQDLTPEESAELDIYVKRDVKQMSVEEIRYMEHWLKTALQEQRKETKELQKARNTTARERTAALDKQVKDDNPLIDFDSGLPTKAHPFLARLAYIALPSDLAFIVDDARPGGLAYQALVQPFEDAARTEAGVKADSLRQLESELGVNFDTRPYDAPLGARQYRKADKRKHLKTHILESGKRITLTDGQLISIYRYALNPTGAQRLAHPQGGLVYPWATDAGKAIRLSEDDVATLAHKVASNPELLRVHDAVAPVLDKTATDAINKASTAVSGYERAIVEDYLMMVVSGGHRMRSAEFNATDPANIQRVANQSLEALNNLKPRLPGAHAPLVVHDIFELMRRSVRVASLYGGYAEPVDMVKRMLSPLTDEQGSAAGGLQTTISRAYGKTLWNELIGLARHYEVSAGPTTMPGRWWNSALRMHTQGVFAGNLPIFSIQPLSYIGALVAMPAEDWRYALRHLPASYDEMGKYSDLLYLRGKGRINMDTDYLANPRGRPNVIARRGQGGMKKGDREAIGRIWNGYKHGFQGQFPKESVDEIGYRTARRTEDEISASQPDPGIASRSSLQRDPNSFIRGLMRFTSQRVKYASMAFRATYAWAKGRIPTKEMLRVMAILVLAGTAFGMNKAFWIGLYRRWGWKRGFIANAAKQTAKANVVLAGRDAEIAADLAFSPFAPNDPVLSMIGDVVQQGPRLARAMKKGDSEKVVKSLQSIMRYTGGFGSGLHNYAEPLISLYQWAAARDLEGEVEDAIIGE